MKKIFLYRTFILSCIFNFLSLFYHYSAISTEIVNNYITSYGPMLEKVIPSVVSVYIEGTIKSLKFHKKFKCFFKQENPKNKHYKLFEGIGSGVIINANKGYIITNFHVVNGANKIKIKLNDGRKFNATVIGCDDKTDLAVLKIPSLLNIEEIKIADSNTLKVGDFSVAVGNPFNLEKTATSGIVSALGRNVLNLEGLENFIQTDASINRGNSGGALVNFNGELIGINTAILATGGGNIGIGFAIPSNTVLTISKQLIKYGKVTRRKFGIKCAKFSSEINKVKGVFVKEVLSGVSVKTGIKIGDIISVKNWDELRKQILYTFSVETINLVIIQNLKLINISIVLDKNYYFFKNLNFKYFQGADLIDSKFQNFIFGIKVVNIVKDSPAAIIGIKKDDMITVINKKTIYNISALRKFLKTHIPIKVVNLIR